MKYFRTLITVCLLTTAGTLLTAGDSKSIPVVESKDFTITLEAYESIAATQSPMLQKSLMEDDAKRMEFLEKIINMNLLAVEAEKRGLDQNPEVVTVRKNRLATLMHSEIADRFKEREPTEAEMRKYYEDNNEKYNKPEKMRARHILMTDRQKAEELLDDLLKDDISQYKFRRVAQEHSVDEATRHRGGDLTFFTREGKRSGEEKPVAASIAEATFNIKENGMLAKELVKTDEGFHIIMRTGHRNPMNLSFEEAKARLAKLVQREMHQERTDQAIEELKEKYKVQLFEENLKHVVIDSSKDAGKSQGAMRPPRPAKR